MTVPEPPRKPMPPTAYDLSYEEAKIKRQILHAEVLPYPQAVYDTFRTFMRDFSNKHLHAWEMHDENWRRLWNKAFSTYRMMDMPSFWKHLVYGTYNCWQRTFVDSCVEFRRLKEEEILFLDRLVERSCVLGHRPEHRDWYRDGTELPK